MASIVNPKQRGLKRVTDHAENRERVANGRTAVAAIGSRFDVVSGQFGIRSSGALLLDPLLEELRRGGGWFDLQNTYQKSWTWPLIADSAQDEESNDQGGPDYTVIALNAREMVA